MEVAQRRPRRAGGRRAAVTLDVGVDQMKEAVGVGETVGVGVIPGVGVGVAADETTVCETPGEVEPLKLASPEYVATSVLVPGVNEISWQLPELDATTIQLLDPSLIVTVPVGFPLAAAFFTSV